MARRRGFINRDVWEVFLGEVSRHGSIRKACTVASVTRAQYREKMQDPDFQQRYYDAVDDATDRIEEAATTFARVGEPQLLKYLLDAKRYKRGEGTNAAVAPVINITVGKTE
ncbi:hypothetical protein QJV44_gp55 [Serratia phage vB_SmaS_Tlacuache]|uniref:Terminase small subunit n=1 Tax=Serratia phage vB_SmaS_Tlacuache TaxID=2894809 RepID=A0AAE8YYV3_9CAUD|nr:hypothetical protein QJV44_gp55 [Serratia phage vB_SmaS_Tlacuache]UGO51469.1 hypothetical protein TLACUACHE_55 [Serratia phage vB_SmaS_Tlacuache]